MHTENFSFSSLDANEEYFQAVLPFSIVLGLLAAVGIFGNAFVLYVYTFKYPVCNFKYFVLVLGSIDLLSCMLTIPGEVYTQYTWFTMPNVTLCKAKSFFNVATVSCSSMVLLLIAVDRYRKVCCPHGWQIKPHCALRLSVSLSILTFAWSIPGYILCGPQTYRMSYNGNNFSVTICLKDDEHKESAWPSMVMKAGYIGPNSFIMLTTVVLYVFIARAIFKRTVPPVPSVTIQTCSTLKPSGKPTVNENSETLIEPSVVDSEFVPSMHGVRGENRISGELSSTPENTLHTFRNSGTLSGGLLLAVPKLESQMPTALTPRVKRERATKNVYASVQRRRSHARVRRKTLIMFILTAFFVVSISVYFILASQMSDKGVFFKDMRMRQEVLVMFFFRFYYFNSLINAFVYGILDPRFRRVLRRASRRMSRSMTSVTSYMHAKSR